MTVDQRAKQTAHTTTVWSGWARRLTSLGQPLAPGEHERSRASLWSDLRKNDVETQMTEILPILGVGDLDATIEFINAQPRSRPKPLAVYASTKDAGVRNQIAERTSSGGLGFNLMIAQLAVATLPFGWRPAAASGR